MLSHGMKENDIAPRMVQALVGKGVVGAAGAFISGKGKGKGKGKG